MIEAKLHIKSPAELSQRLLESGILKQGDYSFAGGDTAYQKIDWSVIDPESEVYQQTVLIGARRIKSLFGSKVSLIPLPDGANEYTERVAETIGCEYADVLCKPDSSSRDLQLKQDTDDRYESITRGVVVDDVFTTGSTINRAHSILGNRLIGGLVIWDRSPELGMRRDTLFRDTGMRVDAIIYQHVPYIGA